MDLHTFRKIPRLTRECIVTEKLDGSNGQVYIHDSNNNLLFPFVKYEEIPSCDFIQEYCLAQKEGIYMFAGSRHRWLSTGKQNDSHGFASWVKENSEELFKLGEGRHYGEWYGKGIQRGYGLEEKRWALFNTSRWANKNEPLAEKQTYCPTCCEVVPILHIGPFETQSTQACIDELKINGSRAVPGYMKPEGIVVYHTAGDVMFKKTIEKDEEWKGVQSES